MHGYVKGAAEMKEMNIPVGVSDFEEIRKNGYYYIDKSGLIGELLSRTGTKVTLITRPRRFGKTLGIWSNEDSGSSRISNLFRACLERSSANNYSQMRLK